MCELGEISSGIGLSWLRTINMQVRDMKCHYNYALFESETCYCSNVATQDKQTLVQLCHTHSFSYCSTSPPQLSKSLPESCDIATVL